VNEYPSPFHPASAADYLPLTQLRQLQLQRLQAAVTRSYEYVPLFRERMRERELTPAAVAGLTDIAKLPFTCKNDLRDTYPFGLFASPMDEIIRLHASSGTTGKPIVVAYTQQDIDIWSQVMVRSFAACGLHRGDIIQNAYGYGLFTGGLGAHYGAEALGATVIPASGGNTERQIMILNDFAVTAICCTPSYFLHLIERAVELNLKPRHLRVGVFGAEPWTDAMRQRIESIAGIQAFDIYGLSEITGPGVGIECPYHRGLHIFEDHFYPEIIHPDTCEVLPDGVEGELVLTTLSKQAMPMIRYRTRDMSLLYAEPCPCGRTIRRIRRINRRSDDMFIIRGVNVFPSQIESALLQVDGALPHYAIILTRDKGLDEMEIRIEVSSDVISDKVRAVEQLRTRLSHAIEHTIGIRSRVTLVGPRTLARSEGKLNRVQDLREG